MLAAGQITNAGSGFGVRRKRECSRKRSDWVIGDFALSVSKIRRDSDSFGRGSRDIVAEGAPRQDHDF